MGFRVVQQSPAAERFFRTALGQPHAGIPRAITVDKNAAYPAAVTAMKRDGEPWRFSRLRQISTSTTSSSRTLGASSAWSAGAGLR